MLGHDFIVIGKFFVLHVQVLISNAHVYCMLLFIAAEGQRGSTLFLTLHEVLAFSCPVSGRVMYSRNLDFCGGDVSKSGGKLNIQVGF